MSIFSTLANMARPPGVFGAAEGAARASRTIGRSGASGPRMVRSMAVYDVPVRGTDGAEVWIEPRLDMPEGAFFPRTGRDVEWAFRNHDFERNTAGMPEAVRKRARARQGLEAMRGVLDAIQDDMRRLHPRRYTFSGMTPSHDGLYASLADRAGAEGYALRRNGRDFELIRTRPTTGERIAGDLAMNAPLGLGALGYALAPRDGGVFGAIDDQWGGQ